jgi:hypothetical protein
MLGSIINPGSIYRFSLRASLTNFARALGLLARVLVPIAMFCAIGLMILHVLYLRNPARTDTMRNLSIDHLIVLEQIQRAAALPAADVAFLGDSSCLMGIDPASIKSALDLHTVESFCSLGYVGPAGYAQMLAGMIERNAAPKALVLVFHPATFRREPGWDFWPSFVENGGKTSLPHLDFPQSSLDFLEFEWLARLIYSPLPGAYALYYGGEGALRSMIRAHQGSAVDPNTGLNISSMEALHAGPTAPSGEPANFNWNPAYVDALRALGETIGNLPPQTRVYLVVSPVPDSSFHVGMDEERSERLRAIAATLGINSDHILKTPATMFAAFFSSYAHLNRWGKMAFTATLIRELAAAK